MSNQPIYLVETTDQYQYVYNETTDQIVLESTVENTIHSQVETVIALDPTVSFVNPRELADLTDVDATDIQDKDILTWNETSLMWEGSDEVWVTLDNLQQAQGNKADKVDNATTGNFAALDSDGNLTDSGSTTSDFATSEQGDKADTAVQPDDNISTLTNDAGFITGIDSGDVTTALGYTPQDAATAFDGDYNSLANLPTLFDGDYNSLTNTPDLFDGDYNSLTNTPTIPTATSDLTNDSGFITGIDDTAVINALGYTPLDENNAFSGEYSDLTGTPTIPTTTSELTNDAGFITGIDSGDVTTALGYTPQDAATAFDGDYNSLSNQPDLFDGDYNSLDNLPVLFDGDYNSLTNTPFIPTQTSELTNDAGFITGIVSSDITDALGYTPQNDATAFDGDYNSLANLPTLFDGDYNSLANLPTLFDGDYNSLTNTPSIPDNIADLSDVDTTGIEDGNVLVWDQATNQFIPGVGGGGGGSGMDVLAGQGLESIIDEAENTNTLNVVIQGDALAKVDWTYEDGFIASTQGNQLVDAGNRTIRLEPISGNVEHSRHRTLVTSDMPDKVLMVMEVSGQGGNNSDFDRCRNQIGIEFFKNGHETNDWIENGFGSLTRYFFDAFNTGDIVINTGFDTNFQSNTSDAFFNNSHVAMAFNRTNGFIWFGYIPIGTNSIIWENGVTSEDVETDTNPHVDLKPYINAHGGDPVPMDYFIIGGLSADTWEFGPRTRFIDDYSFINNLPFAYQTDLDSDFLGSTGNMVVNSNGELRVSTVDQIDSETADIQIANVGALRQFTADQPGVGTATRLATSPVDVDAAFYNMVLWEDPNDELSFQNIPSQMFGAYPVRIFMYQPEVSRPLPPVLWEDGIAPPFDISVEGTILVIDLITINGGTGDWFGTWYALGS